MQNEPYQYILFDWDGCLAQTLDAWLDSYVDTLAAFGVQRSRVEIAAHLGDWNVHTWGLSKEHGQEFDSQLLKQVNLALATVQPYEHAIELLKALRQNGHELAIVTSSDRNNLDLALASTGAGVYIDAVVSIEDVVNHKPHPEPLLLAMQMLGAKPEQTVMIGDSHRDINAAHAAGTDSILIFHPQHSAFYDRAEMEASNPTHICERFTEVAEILSIKLA